MFVGVSRITGTVCSGGLMKLWVVWTIVCRRELADDCWFQVSLMFMTALFVRGGEIFPTSWCPRL